MRLSRGLTAGLMLQAAQRSGPDPRYRTYPKRDHDAPRRPTSFVPMLRLGYTPEARDRQASGGARRARYSLASGVASGFEGGAGLQTELRASIPLGGGVLAVEPAVAVLSVPGTLFGCGTRRACETSGGGAGARMLGLGLTAHSGRFRVVGMLLADAYLGTGMYLVSPTSDEPDEVRLALVSGVAVPVARGIALGAEVQVSPYTDSSSDRSLISFAPMARVVVGG